MTEQEETRPYLTTVQAADKSGLTKSYLTLLLRKGRLAGFRYPDTEKWFIYVDSLEAFLASERKPGPKGPRRSGEVRHGDEIEDARKGKSND